MGRVRSLAFSMKFIAHEFQRTISVQSSSGVIFGEAYQLQRALIHSRTAQHVGLAPCQLLSSKRSFHATGARFSMQHDYYETLGVSKDSNRDEIKKAFHALAKKYHPDANKNNPSAKRKFQEIRDAYEILQDPEKKKQYDKMRESSRKTKNAEHRNRAWDQFGVRDAHGPEFSGSFHKIFSEIFENDSEYLGGDIQVDLMLTFPEAVRGCTKNLSFDADVPCDSCYGRGHPLNAETKNCPICKGIGKVTIPPFTTTCSSCKGFGRIVKEYCVACKGSGVRAGVREVKVAIPAGVDSGDTIRVPNAGNSGGWGRSSGTLFIKLKVAEDHIFSRKGADLYVDSYISFTQAILGGSVEVPTVSGMTQLRIPRGVQHGQLILLRGKGLPKSGFLSNHGDQYVRFCIKFPSNVTEKQRAILEEFEEGLVDENNASTEGSWWQFLVDRATGSNKLLIEFSVLMLIFLVINLVVL